MPFLAEVGRQISGAGLKLRQGSLRRLSSSKHSEQDIVVLANVAAELPSTVKEEPSHLAVKELSAGSWISDPPKNSGKKKKALPRVTFEDANH